MNICDRAGGSPSSLTSDTQVIAQTILGDNMDRCLATIAPAELDDGDREPERPVRPAEMGDVSGDISLLRLVADKSPPRRHDLSDPNQDRDQGQARDPDLETSAGPFGQGLGSSLEPILEDPGPDTLVSELEPSHPPTADATGHLTRRQ